MPNNKWYLSHFITQDLRIKNNKSFPSLKLIGLKDCLKNGISTGSKWAGMIRLIVIFKNNVN